MGEKKVVISYSAPFLNSDNIFVEYEDVLKSPSFVFLLTLHDSSVANTLFDMSPIQDYSVEELYEWYIHRKEKNMFKNFSLQNTIMEKFFHSDISLYEEWIENFQYDEIEQLPHLITDELELNFSESLRTLLSTSLVKKAFIYTEKYSSVIKQDVIENYKCNYVYGDLLTVLKDNQISHNSTFVFSDKYKILTLEKANLIELSSIIVADNYGYNKKEKLDILLEDVYKKYTFKLDFFDAIS